MSEPRSVEIERMRQRLQAMAEQCGESEYETQVLEYVGQAELALRRLAVHLRQLEQAAGYVDAP